MDPYSLLVAFRKKALSLGARYVESEVIGIETTRRSATVPFISRLTLSNGESIEVSQDTLILNTSGTFV